jgi:Flp pilus assembly protein TadG
MPTPCRIRTTSLRREEGQAAVEFALVVPLLLALLLGIVQAGIAFNHYLAVTDAARAAARQAIEARVAGVTVSDIQQAAQNAAGGLDLTGRVSVADPSDPTLTHAGSTLTVTVVYPYSIDILGLPVSSGNLQSTMTDRLE